MNIIHMVIGGVVTLALIYVVLSHSSQFSKESGAFVSNYGTFVKKGAALA